MLRRVIDIAASVAGIVVALPLGLVVGGIIKVVDGGPVFFRQERDGLHGKPFRIFKFKSMKSGSSVPTRVGHLLRRSSVDELPQLINILKGDMSLIGPRPIRREEVAELEAGGLQHDLRLRESVLPGLTGPSQVSCRRYDPQCDASHFEFLARRLKGDVDYIRQRKIDPLIDFGILLKTFNAVVSGKGTNPPIADNSPRGATRPERIQLIP